MNFPKNVDYGILQYLIAKMKKKKVVPEIMPPKGAPTNIRPAGAHDNKVEKKEERKLKQNLRQQNFDDM